MTIREDALRMLAEALDIEDLDDIDETSTMLLAKTRILRLQSDLDRLNAQDTPTLEEVFEYGVKNLLRVYEETAWREQFAKQVSDVHELWLDAAVTTYMQYCANVEYFPMRKRSKRNLARMLHDHYHNTKTSLNQ